MLCNDKWVKVVIVNNDSGRGSISIFPSNSNVVNEFNFDIDSGIYGKSLYLKSKTSKFDNKVNFSGNILIPLSWSSNQRNCGKERITSGISVSWLSPREIRDKRERASNPLGRQFKGSTVLNSNV